VCPIQKTLDFLLKEAGRFSFGEKENRRSKDCLRQSQIGEMAILGQQLI
jgi:hypothetical protein